MTESANKRVLIIEDSVDMRSLLKILLEAKGYTAVFTSNGAEALDLLGSGTALPDIILLDLAMPVMDGHGFLEARALIPNLKNIPVVVMSGEEEAATPSLRSRSSDFLMKPLNILSVVDAIERNSRLH